MAADFSIAFRLAGTKTDPKLAAARTVELLRQIAEKKGTERVLEAIVADQEAIIGSVRAEAERFGAAAAAVFTRVKSPDSGTTSISLESAAKGSLVSSGDAMSKRLKGKTTVEWLALTRKTLENKKRRQKKGKLKGDSAATFFVETGALRDALTQHLGPAFGMIIDPKIVVTRGPRKVSVRLSIMSTASGKEKAGVTGASFPGATGKGATREESLFVRYLKKAGTKDDPKHPLRYKLENPYGVHRSFLQNSLVFWISNQLPIVLEKSLKKALANHKKKGK